VNDPSLPLDLPPVRCLTGLSCFTSQNNGIGPVQPTSASARAIHNERLDATYLTQDDRRRSKRLGQRLPSGLNAMFVAPGGHRQAKLQPDRLDYLGLRSYCGPSRLPRWGERSPIPIISLVKRAAR
jgi:hypothetical protein